MSLVHVKALVCAPSFAVHALLFAPSFYEQGLWDLRFPSDLTATTSLADDLTLFGKTFEEASSRQFDDFLYEMLTESVKGQGIRAEHMTINSPRVRSAIDAELFRVQPVRYAMLHPDVTTSEMVFSVVGCVAATASLRRLVYPLTLLNLFNFGFVMGGYKPCRE